MKLFIGMLIIACLLFVFPYYLYILSLSYHMGRLRAVKETLKEELETIKKELEEANLDGKKKD